MIAFHRRHPVPLALLCAAGVLLVVALVQLVTGGHHDDGSFWAGLLLALTGNSAIAVIRRRETRSA